jgi:hypothetical protein
MIKLTITSDCPKSRALYFSKTALPTCYMEDFTVLGFIVADLQAAELLLETTGYAVTSQRGVMEVRLHGYKQIEELQELFISNKIESSFSDLADTFYQA